MREIAAAILIGFLVLAAVLSKAWKARRSGSPSARRPAGEAPILLEWRRELLLEHGPAHLGAEDRDGAAVPWAASFSIRFWRISF